MGAKHGRPATGFRFLGPYERALLRVTGCHEHAWGFPISTKDMRAAYAANPPYNSHQVCARCGSARLYDAAAFRGGPLFRKEAKA